MKSRKGFTLIELMVVILIVGILAAVSVPLMRGRIDSAKWTEATATAGSMRTALRAYFAEKGPGYSGNFSIDLTGDVSVWGAKLGITSTDLDGHYFTNECYTIGNVTRVGSGDSAYLQYTITVDASASTRSEKPDGTATMNQDGDWTKS